MRCPNCIEELDKKGVCPGCKVRALRDKAIARKPLTKHEIDVLLRACLIPMAGHVLACCDYSQVEARGLAWAANDIAAIEAFRDPHADPYAGLACRLFGIERVI